MRDGDRRGGLLDDAALEASAVAANCAMNRERQLRGVNSYARELGFSPLELLLARISGGGGTDTVAWLDLCCGSGRPLRMAGIRCLIDRPSIAGGT